MVDHILIPTFLGAVLYLVERRRLPYDENRQMVLLVPVCWVAGWYRDRGAEALLKPLNRVLKGVNGEVFAGVREHVSDQLIGTSVLLHIADTGCFVEATATEGGVALAINRLDMDKPSGGSAQQFLQMRAANEDDHANNAHAGGLVARMIRAQVSWWSLPQHVAASVYVPQLHDYHYTPVVRGHLPEHGRDTLKVLCRAIIPGGGAPTRTVVSELCCIYERVIRVRNPERPPSAELLQHQNSFLRRLIPQAGRLRPLSLDEIRALQDRPAQRNRNDMDWHLLYTSLHDAYTMHIKSFQKPEAYPKVGPPRNICTVPTDITVRMAAYCYAFVTAVLKPLPWYAFGKTPREIGERVQAMAQANNRWANTDYSKWDGSMGEVLSTLEGAALLRAFHPDHHQELRTLLDHHVRAKGDSTNHVSFILWFARVTGGGPTSLGNTINNASVTYDLYMRSGLSADEAWAALGLFGGDDGLTPYFDRMDYGIAKTEYGLDLKLEVSETRLPVTLLGRLFYNPQQVPCHIAAPKRCLLRAHLSTLLQYPAFACMYAKVQSWMVSDRDTPIIRAIIDNVMAAHNAQSPAIRRSCLSAVLQSEQSYLFQGQTEPFVLPAAAGDWGMLEAAADDLGVPIATIHEIEQYIITTPFEYWNFDQWHIQWPIQDPAITALYGWDHLIVGPLNWRSSPMLVPNIRENARRVPAAQLNAMDRREQRLDGMGEPAPHVDPAQIRRDMGPRERRAPPAPMPANARVASLADGPPAPQNRVGPPLPPRPQVEGPRGPPRLPPRPAQAPALPPRNAAEGGAGRPGAPNGRPNRRQRRAEQQAHRACDE